MTFINRIINIASQAVARKRDQDYVTRILQGPDTALRSELIEAMATRTI